jgi:type II secretory pathway component PulF
MPAFAYQALDAQGATQSGVVEADSARAARQLLRGRNLIPLSVIPELRAYVVGRDAGMAPDNSTIAVVADERVRADRAAARGGLRRPGGGLAGRG